jgi:signal peptidase I
MWGKPSIGDVLVLSNRINGRTLIKRCFATEGDPIAYRNGCLYVGSQSMALETFPIELIEFNAVPENHIVVLGDNYDFSVDSRTFGFVEVERVVGRALVNRNLPPGQTQGEEAFD